MIRIKKSISKLLILIIFIVLNLFGFTPLSPSIPIAQAATINAASCSQANVQTAISQSVAGDTVMVPAGTCSWAGGLSISGIQLVGAGKSTSGTVITSGAVTMTKNASQYTRVSGFRFTGTDRHITVGGTASNKPYIIDNNYLFTNGGSDANTMVGITVNGGLIHHNDFTASSGTNADPFNIVTGENWSQAPTYGSADTTGERNTYLEDNVFTNILETAPDGDAGGRFVIRDNSYIDSSIVFHGGAPNDSSPNGGTRQFEVYNNTFHRVLNNNPVNKWIWVRGSSGVIANNIMDRADSPDGSTYPNKSEIQLTLACPNAYPMQYQVGQSNQSPENPPSHPLEIFGNTGAGTADSNFITVGSSNTAGGTCSTPQNYIQVGRDYVLSNVWSWTPYTYPHPLQAISGGGSSDVTAPSTPTGLSATVISSSQINLSWTASTDNVGVTGYKVFRNGTQVGTPATNSYSDTGLTASTTYTYTVSAFDAAGNNSALSTSASATTQAAAVDSTSPSTPTALTATATSSSQINLSWTASTDNVGVTGYKIFRAGTQIATSATNSYSNTGLTASTSYSYTVSAYDAAGNNSAQSTSANATTQAASSGCVGHDYTSSFPLTENPISESNCWINGATTGLDWANVQSTPGKGFGTNLPTTYSDPTAVLTGAWGPNQTAQGTISITNSSSCCREVELRLRTTITAHSITGYEINCSVAGTGNQYLQVVRWNGPVSNFTYINEATTNCVNGDVLKASMSGSTITVWKNGTQVLTATDSTFNSGSPGIGFYNTSGGAWSGIAFSNFTATDGTGSSDVTVPSTPTGLSASAISSTQINLSWTASTDNVAVTGYKVFRNGVQIGTPASNSYSDSGLTASTTYSYTVSSFDAAGNNSAQSISASATTQAAVVDATPPTVPVGLSATAISSSQINLSWTASTDNVAVTGYKVFRNGVQIGTPASNSYSDSGLTASTTYSYTVSAYDAASNNSSQSSSASATTQAVSSSNAVIASARQPGGSTTDINTMWANSGVVGGIPNITTQCGSTIAAPSSSAAINSAIQSCTNGFVSLGAGTFNIGAGGIVMKTGVVLRGQGMSTILNMTGTVGGSHWYWGGGTCSLVFSGSYISSAIDQGVPPVTSVGAGTSRAWSGTNGQAGVYTQGATVINLASTPTGLSVGDTLVLWQSDPADSTVPNNGLFFSDESSTSGISWQGSYDDANSAVEQRSRVTAINGTAVTIADSLAHPSYLWQTALSPRAGWITQAQTIHDSGLENLRISSTNQGVHQCDIGVAWGYNIWVRGVGMTPHFTGFHQGGAVDFGFISEDSSHVSFVNNWIDKMIGGGIDTTTSYGVAFKETHHFRVENNIFNNVESPTELLIGSMDGVVGYNYERYVGTEQQEGGIQQHEVASSMNLIEGNTYMKVFMDVFHGNSGVSTYFRNYLTTRGFDLWSYHRCDNIIGNAITATQVRKTLVTDSTLHDRYYGYGFRLGYPQDIASSAGISNPGFVAADPRVIDTTMLWGNYTSTGGTVFDQTEVPSSDATCPNPVPSSQVLPPSLYLSSAPAYFTLSGIGTQPWPLNGPDISGGSFLSGHANKTPAQLVYESVAGNIANYNPSVYGASSSDTTAPSIPTSLSASAISASAINLSWTASTDNVGVTGYKVFRNGTQIGTSVTNSYSDTGLAASTLYSYTVSAYDAAGNNSSQSTSASATTQAAAFDFTITNGGNVSVSLGASVNNNITATLSSGTTQAVSYSISGLPAGVSSTFTPSSCSPTCTTTLALTTTASAATGAATLTITGTGGGKTHTSTFTLTVNAASAPLVGDINGDHIINSVDYSILNSHWFTSDATSDLNQDSLVNSLDWSLMNQNWLKTW